MSVQSYRVWLGARLFALSHCSAKRVARREPRRSTIDVHWMESHWTFHLTESLWPTRHNPVRSSGIVYLIAFFVLVASGFAQ
jgi:hypothetical protein